MNAKWDVGRTENQAESSESLGGLTRLRRQRVFSVIPLIVAHVIALEASLFLGYFTHLPFAGVFHSFIARDTLVSMVFGLLVFVIGYFLAGLYPGYGLAPVERLRREVQVTLLMFLTLIAWEWFFFKDGWFRGVLLLAMGYAGVLVPLGSALSREVMVRLRIWGAPVLILGAAKTGALVARALQREKVLGLNPIGFLDDDPKKWGQEVEGLPVFGPLEQAGRWLGRGVQVAIVAMPGVGRERLVKLLQELPFSQVILVPDLLGLQSLWVSGRDLAGVLALEVKKNLLLRRNKILKKVIDYFLAILGLVVSVPIIVFFALLIQLVSPGPPFYSQERVGYKGKVFRIWKLRTMYLDADKRLQEYLEHNREARLEWEQNFKLKKDPRILPVVGHILRKSSLDELPQLWNVLKGEMSLVGPRPIVKAEVKKYGTAFDLYIQVWPGLTGLWQVSGRTDTSYSERVALDSYYVRNWSLWLDLYILARTFWVVLTRRGAY
ncbi:undecaprenyl-phosphate galactose phosphotransferase WbaP [Thermus sp. LT1-2-5]|uniref:undecaprenyl-phosphate galactose phosphotransferase WbaP n=1 Tax=Thermus sp. LT1-2-5 TaxID=3026935 RepID=UPI0030E97344